MSMEPIQRRMTKPNAGTVQVQELMTDDITTSTFIQLSIPNTILDIITTLILLLLLDILTNFSKTQFPQAVIFSLLQ